MIIVPPTPYATSSSMTQMAKKPKDALFASTAPANAEMVKQNTHSSTTIQLYLRGMERGGGRAGRHGGG